MLLTVSCRPSFMKNMRIDRPYGFTGPEDQPETLIHNHPPMLGLPQPDKNFHLYALPVGNGDASVIQCPLGDLIILDMGQMSTEGWQAEQVIKYLSDDLERIRIIIISHPTPSHYLILTKLINSTFQVPNLERVILAGRPNDYDHNDMVIWINRFSPYVEYVNYGYPCISKCYLRQIKCNGDDNGTIEFKIISANLGNSRKGRSLTMQIKIKKPNFQLFWQGDLRGTDIETHIVDEWESLGYSLNSTHMKIGNRASKYNESNTEYLLRAVTPRFAFSSNPYAGTYALKPDCRTIFRLVGMLTVTKRSKSGYYACEDYTTRSAMQFENWCYNIFTTAPYPSDYSVVAIDVYLANC